jgi:hypothetical protein
VTGPIIQSVGYLLTPLLFFFLLHRATRDFGYSVSLTLLLAASNGFHLLPAIIFSATVFLAAITLTPPGWLRPVAIGFAHGLATLMNAVTLVLGVAAIDAVLRPRPRRRAAGSLVYVAAFFSAGLILFLWPALQSGLQWGFLNLYGFLWGVTHGGAPIWNGWLALHAAAESAILASPPTPAGSDPGELGTTLVGLRTILRALIVGLLIGPLFSRPQTDLSATGRFLARGSILYLAAFVPAWLLIGSWRSDLAFWALPPLFALIGISYNRSHPAGRIAGHHAIVGVIIGIAILLGLHNLLSRLPG